MTSQWDVAGRRTKLTYPGSGLFIDTDYLVTGETTKLRENGATSGVGVLATLAYDDLGRRTSLTRGNGAVTSYGYDPVSRLASLAENFTGTANDQTATFAYTPASQIGSVTKTNDLYAWTGHGSGSTASVANGLNQLGTIGGAATAHDSKGNLTSDPTTGKTYGYSSKNLLTVSTGGTAAGLTYDPAMRLYQLTGVATTRFGYDGTDMIAEYDGSNAVTKRYVHGPGTDEPLVEYDGATTATKLWLHADERGSIIAISDATGTVTQINRYDEYGKPQSTNAGRFQYTGQTWLGEIGLQYSKARMYGPHLGRFWQTDPIGYGDGANLYAYVGNDPINWIDPLGLQAADDVVAPEIVVTGNRGTVTVVNSASLDTIGMNTIPGVRDPSSNNDIMTVICDATCRARGRTPPPPRLPPPPGIVKTVPTFRLAAAARGSGDVCGSPGNSQHVPEGIGATSFQGPCRKHDDCYGTLGKTQEQCDQGLGRDILNDCMRTGGSFCALASYIYYKTLSVTGLGLGTPAFQDAQRQARAALRLVR